MVWGRVLVMVTLAACGRWGFDPDPSTTGDATGDTVLPTTCAALAGTTCSINQICLVATVATTDNPTCCPQNHCFTDAGKQVVAAPQRTTAITIDGIRTDWAGITPHPITGKAHGNPTAADFSATFSVAWDATGLYLLYEMTDDVCRAQDSVPPLTGAFNDDTVEVYLDMDPTNNTAASYTADEAFTWIPQSCGAGMVICGLAPPSAPLTTQLDHWIQQPPMNHSVPGAGLVATYANDGATNCHWWVEAKVTWPSGYPTPIAGDVLGFDAAANDDDTGPRKNQLFWNDSQGLVPTDARRFGLLQLSP